jgi:hypothetical protein
MRRIARESQPALSIYQTGSNLLIAFNDPRKTTLAGKLEDGSVGISSLRGKQRRFRATEGLDATESRRFSTRKAGTRVGVHSGAQTLEDLRRFHHRRGQRYARGELQLSSETRVQSRKIGIWLAPPMKANGEV